MFELFKKNKTPANDSNAKSAALWELFASGELEKRYKAAEVLCMYESYVCENGHSSYFLYNTERLERDLEILNRILPDDLRDNLNQAYTAFIESGNEEACAKADQYLSAHKSSVDEQLLIYANKMGL